MYLVRSPAPRGGSWRSVDIRKLVFFLPRAFCGTGGGHVRGFLSALHSCKGDLGVKSVLVSIVTPR